MKNISVLLSALAMTGCASYETSQWVASSQATIDDLGKAEHAFVCDLINKDGVAAAEIAKTEERLCSEALAKCVDPYSEELARSTEDIKTGLARHNIYTVSAKISSQLKAADEDLLQCSRPLGVAVVMRLTLPNGDSIDMPSYVERIAYARSSYEAALIQASKEEEANKDALAMTGLIFGASLSSYGNAYSNPAQTYVSPYLKRDGSLVTGHWRTMPNDTCLDNLLGCR